MQPFVVPFIPSAQPAAPTNAQIVGNTTSSLTFTLTAGDNGGQEILDYVGQYTTDGATWVTVRDSFSPTQTLKLTGLTTGVQYRMRFAQLTGFGLSPWSSEIVGSPQGTPSPISSVNPTRGNTQVVLGWNAPFDGGLTISDYVIQYSTNQS
jgi:hypothetical protein